MPYIVIMEDGETYGSLEGTEIAYVTNEALEELAMGTKIRNLRENREIYHVGSITRQV